MRARWSLTMRSPCRGEPSGFAATCTCTCPLPWPEEGVTVFIQFASEDADHAHSACVVSPTVAVAPLELTEVVGAVRVTAHLEGEGPVDVATVEPHPPATQANSQTAT